MRKELILGARSLTPWIKGGSWSVEPEGDYRGRPLFRGVSLPERPWSWYDPMREAETAYLDCARIGEDLLIDSHNERHDQIQEQFLVFINQYGPIYISQRSTLKGSPTDGSPLVTSEGITFSLFEATAHAQLLAWALRCYQAIEDPRKLDSAFADAWARIKEGNISLPMMFRDFPATWGSPTYGSDINLTQGDSLEARLYALYAFINHIGMKGTSPGIYFNEIGHWESGYQFDSLASAMWLQLQQAILRKVPVRKCEGCPTVFEASRSNQVYHDEMCRGAAAARRSYHARKGSPNERFH